MSILEAAQGIVNATLPVEWLVVAGQPSEPQIVALGNAGLRNVIDIRDPMEARPFDEPAVTRALGMHYVNAPVVTGALDDSMMDRAIQALEEAAGTPTLLHCNSANRTGGPLIAWLILHEGLDSQDAVDVAMRSGLRSAEIMEWAVDYAERKKQ